MALSSKFETREDFGRYKCLIYSSVLTRSIRMESHGPSGRVSVLLVIIRVQ